MLIEWVYYFWYFPVFLRYVINSAAINFPSAFREEKESNIRKSSALYRIRHSADDFVCCFQYKEEAEKFYNHLKKRMAYFGLQLEENKTRLIHFGRFAEENLARENRKPDTFDFLGFTHYCAKSRQGKFRVKHKTANKKFRKKCKAMNITIRDMRYEKKKYILSKVNQILTGYYHYYGITDNFKKMDDFRNRVIKMLFFWMNRRSQRKSYTWETFNEFLKNNPIVKPKIYVGIYG